MDRPSETESDRGTVDDIAVALVVLSSPLSGEALISNLGNTDGAWNIGDRPSARFNGWELRESASDASDIGPVIGKLLERMRKHSGALVELREQRGAIESVSLWLWVDAAQESIGFDIGPSAVAGIGQLGATLRVKVICSV